MHAMVRDSKDTEKRKSMSEKDLDSAERARQGWIRGGLNRGALGPVRLVEIYRKGLGEKEGEEDGNVGYGIVSGISCDCRHHRNKQQQQL